MLGEQIKSIGSIMTSPVLMCHQWMGFSESTNYRYITGQVVALFGGGKLCHLL